MSRAEIIDCVERHLKNKTKAQPCEEAENKGIVIEYCINIPEGATNGDVIKAMFLNASITEIGGGATVVVANAYKFNISWWGAPYKREVEE